MFDPSKPYVTTGKGNRTLWSQDGVCYDPSTKEPVDPSKLAPPRPATVGESVFVCKFCGAKRAGPELIREHLLAEHRDKVESQRLSPEPAKPANPSAKHKKGRRK
jgi:hypothetical protein